MYDDANRHAMTRPPAAAATGSGGRPRLCGERRTASGHTRVGVSLDTGEDAPSDARRRTTVVPSDGSRLDCRWKARKSLAGALT